MRLELFPRDVLVVDSANAACKTIRAPRVALWIGFLVDIDCFGVRLYAGPVRAVRVGQTIYRHVWTWVIASYYLIEDLGWLGAFSPLWFLWRDNFNPTKAWTGMEREIGGVVWGFGAVRHMRMFPP